MNPAALVWRRLRASVIFRRCVFRDSDDRITFLSVSGRL